MDIKLPSLGEGADSGTVVSVLVKEGDDVKKDQPILELETEKAVGTVPSSGAGKVEKVRVKVGDKISAGQTVLTLSEAGAKEEEKEEKEESEPSEKKAEAKEEKEQEKEKPKESKKPAEKERPKSSFPPPAPPSIRKLAGQIGLDLGRVQGTEHGGRITLEDIRAYVAWLQTTAFKEEEKAGEGKKVTPAGRLDFSQWGPILKKPLSSIRKTIARRMGESWSAVPRVTQFDEADITKLNELRKKHEKLTLTPLAIKAVVATLKKHLIFNSSLDEFADEIVLKEYFHIGVAVDTEHGLMVPVVRDADKKTVQEISKELEELAAKARDRKLSADDMKGGTFTISNQGGIGGGHFTPIVNLPEVAILGIGRGAMKPVVRDGKIEPRLMLPLALSYDHRVIDGGSAARFIVDLVAELENLKV